MLSNCVKVTVEIILWNTESHLWSIHSLEGPFNLTSRDQNLPYLLKITQFPWMKVLQKKKKAIFGTQQTDNFSGKNVSILLPQNSYVEILTSKGDGWYQEVGLLGGSQVMSVEPSLVPLLFFIKKIPHRAPASSPMWSHSEKTQATTQEEDSHQPKLAPWSWTSRPQNCEK